MQAELKQFNEFINTKKVQKAYRIEFMGWANIEC